MMAACVMSRLTNLTYFAISFVPISRNTKFYPQLHLGWSMTKTLLVLITPCSKPLVQSTLPQVRLQCPIITDIRGKGDTYVTFAV